jgi:hypothetical protein
MIFQTLQEETMARGARKIEIINIGLEPWEAVAMGLEVETLEEGKQRKAVADYVDGHDGDWADWLQTHRVELNVMTTPQLIEWLDGKMAGHGKLIPPEAVLQAELAERLEDGVRADLTERILREADLDVQVAAALAAIKPPSGATLKRGITRLFEQEADREWRDYIREAAQALRKKGLQWGRERSLLPTRRFPKLVVASRAHRFRMDGIRADQSALATPLQAAPRASDGETSLDALPAVRAPGSVSGVAAFALLRGAPRPQTRPPSGVALMLRVPLWPGPSHVMKLRPIGIAGDLDQPEPPRHDHVQALAKRRRCAFALRSAAKKFLCHCLAPRCQWMNGPKHHVGRRQPPVLLSRANDCDFLPIETVCRASPARSLAVIT